MSENIFESNDEFFSNGEIPNTMKLGAIALLLKGTSGTATSPNGKVKSFVSMVFNKMNSTTICFDYSNPDSLGKNAQAGLYNQLAGEKIFNGKSFADIVSGNVSDQEIVKATADHLKTTFGLNDQGLKNCNVKESFAEYFRNCKEVLPECSNIFDSLLYKVEEIYSSEVSFEETDLKKNEIRSNVMN